MPKEDEERCLQSSINPTASRGAGSDDRGKLCPFSGTVQAVENGHTQYPDYPLRITMK
jgi:hypothetical protein